MKNGFTLLEVLMSILLMGIITCFWMVISNVLIEDDLMKSESQATILAEKKLEEYRRTIISNWTATFTMTGNFSLEGWTMYNYTITVTFLHTTNLRQVRIMVWEDTNNNYTWDTFEGKSVLITMISRRR